MIKLKTFLEELEHNSKAPNTDYVNIHYVIERVKDILGKDLKTDINKYDTLISELSKDKNFYDVYEDEGLIIINPVQNKQFFHLSNLLGKYEIDWEVYEANGVEFAFKDWSYMNGIVYEIRLELI
jgi:hypothetical protein